MLSGIVQITIIYLFTFSHTYTVPIKYEHEPSGPFIINQDGGNITFGSPNNFEIVMIK